jgi:hypothetical protein
VEIISIYGAKSQSTLYKIAIMRGCGSCVAAMSGLSVFQNCLILSLLNLPYRINNVEAMPSPSDLGINSSLSFNIAYTGLDPSLPKSIPSEKYDIMAQNSSADKERYYRRLDRDRSRIMRLGFAFNGIPEDDDHEAWVEKNGFSPAGWEPESSNPEPESSQSPTSESSGLNYTAEYPPGSAGTIEVSNIR